MSAPCAVIASVIFSWLGLVVGSYFIEVPLKYIVASASLQTSRWIEWPVLRALDVAEIVMADVVVTAILAGQVPVGVMGRRRCCRHGIDHSTARGSALAVSTAQSMVGRNRAGCSGVEPSVARPVRRHEPGNRQGRCIGLRRSDCDGDLNGAADFLPKSCFNRTVPQRV
jgi:hypothetical protein